MNTHHLIVKICGVTDFSDARFALDAGADWIGLNHVSGPRRIQWDTIESIITSLNDPSRAVVLLRAEGGRIEQQVLGGLHAAGVRRVQLYGDHLDVTVHQMADEGVQSIVAWHVSAASDLDRLEAFLVRCGTVRPDYVLFDAAAGEQPGGTGRRTNWQVIAEARARGADRHWPPFLLAGGLTPQSVADAVRTLHPAGVDVSSGVESTPGRKDPQKAADFIAVARACEEVRD